MVSFQVETYILPTVLWTVPHMFDYIVAFGVKFNITYFIKGYSFLKSDRIYIPFHSLEIVIICFLLYLFFNLILRLKAIYLINLKSIKTMLLIFSISLFLHLSFDTISNNLPISTYFFTKRLFVNFELKHLVSEIHYQKHSLLKQTIKLQ
jgi:hypothetical protein